MLNAKLNLYSPELSIEDVQILQERVRLLEAVVENFPGGLLLFDRELRLAFCNRFQRQLLDYPESLFAGEPPTLEQMFWFNALRGEYGEGDAAEQVNYRMELVARRREHVFERRRPNGTLLEVRGKPLPEGGFVTTYLDVTAQRQGQEALAYLAHHDTVSQLPNRAALMKELAARLAVREEQQHGAVLFLDLDNFKPVNDIYGHDAGDELLKLVGNRLRRTLREKDFVCRYGGDEFVVVQADAQDRQDIEALANRLLRCLVDPFEIDGVMINVGVSIGISVFPGDGTNVEELVTKADKSMYTSKRGMVPFVFAAGASSTPTDRRRARDADVLKAFE
jgi:diguanylate cyclase (GGDEF)-like protein